MWEKAVFEIKDELIKIRESLHRIPELCFCEEKTSALIRNYLDQLGISYQTMVKTGVAAVIDTGKPGKTILLRADMDGLPIAEENDLPFRSEHFGCMHACGHDVHTACLLGAAKILNQYKDHLCGTIRLVFQPAEEGEGGALPMIEAGVMENPCVDAAIALHVEPLAKWGTLQFRDGAIMASPDEFVMTVHGIGGHGAVPEKCVDPIAVAAEIIKAYQGIARRTVGAMNPCVVSVCSVHAGNCPNVIPETAYLEGTVRSLDPNTRKKIAAELQNCAETIAKAMGGSCEFTYRPLYPPTINTPAMNQLVRNAAKKLSCVKKTEELEFSSLAGDDFAYFAERVPACYFRLGVGDETHNNPIHSPDFFANENALPIGTAVLVQSVVDFLNS